MRSDGVAAELRMERVGVAQKRFISGWTNAEDNQAEPLVRSVGTIEMVDSTEDVRLVCRWCCAKEGARQRCDVGGLQERWVVQLLF